MPVSQISIRFLSFLSSLTRPTVSVKAVLLLKLLFSFFCCCCSIFWKDWCWQRLLNFKSLSSFSLTISDDGALTAVPEPLQGVPSLPELRELSAHLFMSAASSSASQLWSNKRRPNLGFPSTLKYWSVLPVFYWSNVFQSPGPDPVWADWGTCLGMANWYYLQLDGASSLFLPNTLVPRIPALQSLLLLEGRGPLAGTCIRAPEQSPGNNFSLHFQARCFAEDLSNFVVTPSSEITPYCCCIRWEVFPCGRLTYSPSQSTAMEKTKITCVQEVVQWLDCCS